MNPLCAPALAEGDEVRLLPANDRTGVEMLSSSSIVLYRYRSLCSLPGKVPVFRKSFSFVLRSDENVGGLSSKMVSIGGPRFPELLRVVLVGMES